MSLIDVIIIDEQTRRFYSKGDYEFFLKHHLKKTSRDNLSELYRGYDDMMDRLKKELKINKKQQLLLIDSYIRKMHSGGLLPNVFNLTKSIGYNTIDLFAEGENMAYFKVWQKYEKRRYFYKRIWDKIIKIGAILGFVLSIIKILEIVNQK